jgi:protein-S-isoprenylcysteine O-methyltransferase Ste14
MVVPMTASVAKIMFVLAMLIFAAIRFPHEYLGQKAPVARADRGWRERVRLLSAGLGLAAIPLVDATSRLVRFADLEFRPLLAWIGAAVFAVALWIFWRAHRALGQNFSSTLVVRRSHTLVTHGIYAHVRHPMYTGFWLWAATQALLLQNWLVALCGFAGFGILFFGRIGEEERLMLETFGEQYDAFARRTKRLVPWIY